MKITTDSGSKVYHATLIELCELLGAHRTTLANRAYRITGRDGKNNTYDATEVIRDHINRLSSKTDEDIDRAKLRYTTEQANLKEITRKQLEGELVNVEDVESIWSEHIMTVKRTFKALPTRHGIKLAGITDYKEMIKELDTMFDKTLTELSVDKIEYIRATEKRIKKKLATPAKANDKPVGKRKPKTKQ
jgi:phage terminase Nu1 subunit (DNA packaging protein)